jgi:D-alanine--poly(phosphoribitol) ligase subunit 2
MMDEETARRVVYDAIDIVNQQLPASKRLRKAPDTVIVGAGGALDSLGVVSFVIAVEEKVAELTGAAVQLLDETMLAEGSPFHTAGSLARYIAARPS